MEKDTVRVEAKVVVKEVTWKVVAREAKEVVEVEVVRCQYESGEAWLSGSWHCRCRFSLWARRQLPVQS